MAQLWSKRHAGKRSNGGIENESVRTGFSTEAALPFGRGVVQKRSAAGQEAAEENLVVLVSDSGNPYAGVAQFQGFAAYSTEATGFTKDHTGPGVRYAAYPEQYLANDVVGLIDRGSVIVQIDPNETAENTIQAGDRLCVVNGGYIRAAKHITASAEGTKKALMLNAIAESNGKNGEFIGIQIYSLDTTEVKFV